MTFVSYAQNFEDVLLRRALSSVSKGFYIDIGAGDPDFNSVTKAFYLSGWSGVNVEPIPYRYSLLQEKRTRDVNVAAVCADVEGEESLFLVEDYDELSSIRREVLATITDDRIQKITVPSETLASICYRHVEGPIHFLKIDVEGAELRVLEGADFSAFRPWIIVVETFAGDWGGVDRSLIESKLNTVSYKRVFFDGINDYFIASEHLHEMGEAFSYPPCVRDNFVSSRTSEGFAARIGTLLDSTSVADENETLSRISQLRRDRIELGVAVEVAQDEIERLKAELDKAQLALVNDAEHKELLLQRSFERERYLAFQSGEVARLRHQVDGLHRQTIDGQEVRREFTESSSWRLTLPLRVVRHPRKYLRHLLNR